ncbi:hypothetical protein TNIN_41591 [Trichonephila inaurata madagascariensis]|uniref:Uncharacterized protein n=1 Tax=Trichonephila inaurata madagascariensis TaxID=2747483 RepID=A0A8X6YBM7_9ARAC|nr:hypothetical protein TNIN_41591 [Trichonephila inaurata madagascariensis]
MDKVMDDLPGSQMAYLDGHDIVENGVDGAVDKYHRFAEHEEPELHVAVYGKRVIYDQHPVWEPQGGEYGHDHSQHFHDLKEHK